MIRLHPLMWESYRLSHSEGVLLAVLNLLILKIAELFFSFWWASQNSPKCRVLIDCKENVVEHGTKWENNSLHHTRSCPTLSDPMDCSLPGSSFHGIFQQEYWSGVPLPSPLYTAVCIIQEPVTTPLLPLTRFLSVSSVTWSLLISGRGGTWTYVCLIPRLFFWHLEPRHLQANS